MRFPIAQHALTAGLLAVVGFFACASPPKTEPIEIDDTLTFLSLCAAHFCDTNRWPSSVGQLQSWAAARGGMGSRDPLIVQDWTRYADARVATTEEGAFVVRLERLGNFPEGPGEFELPPPSCSAQVTLKDVKFRAPPTLLK